MTSRELIKKTRSICSVCKQQVDAEVVKIGNEVFLNCECNEHGFVSELICSDHRYYYQSHGSSCCQPEASGQFDKLSTCIAVLDIVEDCNLDCPVCYAASPHEVPAGKFLSFDEVRARVEALVERKGKLDILQLSGGEPTLHPKLIEIVRWAVKNPMVGYVLLNTNGIRLSAERALAEELGGLHKENKGFEIYLQFDGAGEQGQVLLRGRDMRSVREKALAHLGVYGVPVTLAMTVIEANLPTLGDTLRFALEQPNVRGMSLQPAFLTGRCADLGRRVNIGDIVPSMVEQSHGLLAESDFTPLPCGDPNCHTVCYLVQKDGAMHSLTPWLNQPEMHEFLKDRINYRIEDLQSCGCESEPLGRWLKALEVGVPDIFRIVIKPFMDVATFDQHRIDRCCTHVLLEGGRLDSFCRHYALASTCN